MSYRNDIISAGYVDHNFVDNETPDFVNGVATGMPLVDVTQVGILMPLNPVTGHRDGDLKRLFDPNVSVKEKELIMANLKELKSKNNPKGLTDDDLMLMIPSRYISDAVEVEHWMQSLKEFRDGIIASKEEEKTDPEPAPVDPAPTPTSAE